MQTQAYCSQLCNPVSTDEIPTTSSTRTSSHDTLVSVCLACEWIVMVRSDPPRAAVIVAADWWKLGGPECTHIVLWAPGLTMHSLNPPLGSKPPLQAEHVSFAWLWNCEIVWRWKNKQDQRKIYELTILVLSSVFFPDDSLFADFIRSFFAEYRVFCFQRFFSRGEGGVRWWERRLPEAVLRTGFYADTASG